ncbi:MAG: LysR family transcriptional regulator [Slackia sp.]|nr:LysR family transcriptional regulator [Slackia sp.]
MYDRRLDSIVAAADCGSFSKAAKQLGVSTPALAKRIEAFEAEYDIALFNRTRRGVFLTPAGASIVDDARALMRQSRDVLRRAREQETFGGVTVRLGISAACPAPTVLAAWPRIHESDSSLHLELVPIGDIYDDDVAVVAHLGGSVDIVEVSDVSLAACEKLWGSVCRVDPLPSVSGGLAYGASRTDARFAPVASSVDGALAAAAHPDVSSAPASLSGCGSFDPAGLSASASASDSPAVCAIPVSGVLLWPSHPSSATARFVALLNGSSQG